MLVARVLAVYRCVLPHYSLHAFHVDDKMDNHLWHMHNLDFGNVVDKSSFRSAHVAALHREGVVSRAEPRGSLRS